MNREKIIKGLFLICGIIVLVSLLTRLAGKNSTTLEDYARENPGYALADKSTEQTSAPLTPSSSPVPASPAPTVSPAPLLPETTVSLQDAPIGKRINGDTVYDLRVTYEEGFYYEPLSDNLRRYITGVSYPASTTAVNVKNASKELAVTYDDLCYLHILHIDFEGNTAEGELICNKSLAQDLVEIFHELYVNEYRIEKVKLIDEYDGDDDASMEDNNTSCFNYRPVGGGSNLSKHALGCALDINPLYNPYITYQWDNDGKLISENIAPASAAAYADRSANFPYKIDENDLCYKLFTAHGFSWGGYFNNSKDYQHFYKVVQ